MKYYNDKKYYVKRVLRIAKKNNFQEDIIYLKLLHRNMPSIVSTDFVKDINDLKIRNADLFNIENKDEE